MTDDDRQPVDGHASPAASDAREGAVTTETGQRAGHDGATPADEIDLTDRATSLGADTEGGDDPDAEGADRDAADGDRTDPDPTDGEPPTEDGTDHHEVRRVATLGVTASSPDGRVTTGVLEADATTRVELARRRRWLVGGGVLGLVVVLAYVLVTTLSANQAQDAARAEARQAELAASFARGVVDRAESYETPAAALAVDARALSAALEEHLTTTERSGEDLDEVVALTTTSLRSTADELDQLTARPLPPLDGLVAESDATAVLTALEQLRVEAEALVTETRTAADDAEAWSEAVRDVDAALAAHGEVVAAKPADSTPTALAEGWRSEVAPLEALDAAAADAEQVPGLERWAAAHRAYARGTLDFIAEAVPLLEDGDTDSYNELFEATFDEDPFSLREEARAGAEQALVAGPIISVATVTERARIVTDQVVLVEATVVRTLGSGS